MERFKLKSSERPLSCSCFICLEPVKRRGFNGEQLTSLNFLFNYLKIGNKVGPVVCEKCGETLVKFMKLGKMLEKVRLEMDYLLGVIQLAISKSKRGTKRAPVVLISVRESVVKKCREKSWSPKIILERCDAPSILKAQGQSPVPDCSDDWEPDGVVAEDSTPDSDVFQPDVPSIGLKLSSAHEERRHHCQVPGCDSNYCHRSRLLIHYKKEHPDFLAAQDREYFRKECREKVPSIELQTVGVSKISGTEDQSAIPDCSDDWVPSWDEDEVNSSINELGLAPNDSDVFERSAASEINETNLENGIEEPSTSTAGSEMGLPPNDSHILEGSSVSGINETKTKLENKIKAADIISKAKTGKAKCPKCLKTFSSKPLMKQHFNAVHLRRKPFKCTSCPKSFSFNQNLRKHINAVHAHAEKVILCDICKKLFKTQILLKSHLFSAHEKRGHHCKAPGCSKTYSDRSLLLTHYKVDHQYKLLPPELSQKTPPISLDLDYSEKIENGETLFECNHCGKQLKNKMTVIAHIEVLHAPPKAFPCPDCNFSTDSQFGLVSHSKIHREHRETKRRQVPTKARKNLKTVKCDKCPKAFRDKRALFIHNASVHIRQMHKCLKCGKAFTNHIYLSSHNRLVHLYPKRKNPLINCPKCSETFTYNSQFKIHMNTIHQELTPFRCSECPKSFKDDHALKAHKKRVHLQIKPHMCDVCGKTFGNFSGLRYHKITHADPQPKPQRSNSERVPCPKCEKTFANRRAMNAHKRFYHLRNGFQCELCDKKYWAPMDLRRHVESFHEKIRHHCQVEGCDKDYSTAKILNSHYRLEHPDFPIPGLPEPPKRFFKRIVDGAYVYECKFCDKQYKTADSVNGHVKSVHEPKTTLVCEICGFITTSKPSLRIHMKNKHDLKAPESGPDPGPVFCDICNDIFTSVQYLKMHIRHKHGPKEFKCHLCDKEFKNNDHLNRHVSGVHEKIRHHCEVEGCDLSYSQESDLLKHYKSQHPHITIPPRKSRIVSKYADMFTSRVENGESVFECKLCEGKKFKTFKSISLHVRKMHGSIEFKCPDCSFETVFKAQLESHVKLAHKDRLGDGESRQIKFENELIFP